jgi:hypothetical protein
LKPGSYGTASPISKPGQSSISANRAISKLDLAIWQAPVLMETGVAVRALRKYKYTQITIEILRVQSPMQKAKLAAKQTAVSY